MAEHGWIVYNVICLEFSCGGILNTRKREIFRGEKRWLLTAFHFQLVSARARACLHLSSFSPPRSFKSRFVNCKSYFSCNFFPSSLWAQLTLFFLCAFRFVSCNLSCFLLEFYSPPLQSICKHCECFESISILRHFRFVSYFFLSSSVFVKVNARNSGRCTCVYLAPYGCAIYQTINILKKV